ncbi:MAG: alpha/beta hydrolase [Acidimicrobiales bacterium]|nr:alpha/beta hydrolase [Acidimicrobiales bacterium]
MKITENLKRQKNASYEDVAYLKHNSGELYARVWRSLSGGPLQGIGIVDVHGGAWSSLDRTSGDFYNEFLCSMGATVISLDFRCGPKYQHPTAVRDVCAGVRWVRIHASKLKIEETQIFSIGSSSGGHIALMAALNPALSLDPTIELNGLDSTEGIDKVDASVIGVGVFWAPVDPLKRFLYAESLRTEHGNRLARYTEAYFGNKEMMKEASIPRLINTGAYANLPPIFFAEAEHDQNVPSSIVNDLCDAFANANGLVSRKLYGGAQHGFGQHDGIQAREFLLDLATWMRKTSNSTSLPPG